MHGVHPLEIQSAEMLYSEPCPPPDQNSRLYNEWQNGTYPNYGLEFRPVLNSNNNFDQFYSSDYTGDPTLRPKLVITTGN